MSKLFQPSAPLPDDFSGFARLFPLPNLVMFPHVLLPLHIFEPRYRAMVADALAGDRLIAMALLRPGWESDYEGRPPIFPTCCLGRIAQQQRLPDGRFHLLLQGVARVRVVQESDEGVAFRTARVSVHQDPAQDGPDAQRQRKQQQLLQCVEELAPGSLDEQPQLRKLLQSALPLGTLSDVIGYCVGLDVLEKQQILDELDVAARADKLVAALQGALEQVKIEQALRGRYPMKFSEN